MKALILNLGGTSTKIALCEDEKIILKETIRHSTEELEGFKKIWDQYDYRMASILSFLKINQLSVSELDLFISRGPSVKPLESGVYEINEAMVTDAKSGEFGQHVCNLGCAIALAFAQENGKTALIADPPCVDEMIPIARYTGLPQITRHSYFQALSHKAFGRFIASKLEKDYRELSIVITHLGSGISCGTHKNGKVIDITNGLDGDAPFGMDRSGTLPAADWKKLIQSGNYTNEELDYMLNGGGGLMAHLGTNNGEEIERRIKQGDAKALEVFEAMAFQVSKAIGAAAGAMGGRPDAIGITGGLAHSKHFVDFIKKHVWWMAPIYVKPDIDELEALSSVCIPAYFGEIEIKDY
ncbi:butyrate kinase [Enterococcus hulanensis]|uniref:butyrate kinase n=1 Tax=Enterococcus TaxID=1350 RepID=UPI000B5A5CE8|nr:MULTISPECIES: butyrate kinase [Enterococcus]MBO0411452.1 butyrate kinase [Enterococcus hulanensis]OTO14198.1 butyrate kinase [Enterococcus sp. 3H8_DIV0648]